MKVGLYTIIDENVTIGNHVYIGNYVHIRPNVIIGDNTEIRDYCFLAEGCEIGHDTNIYQYSNIGSGTKIGNWCFIGVRVITANDKEITWPKNHPNAWNKQPPIIGNYVRVGSGSLILPNVHLADRSRIGSGSVVTKDTEYGKTYLGVPARIKGV